ncbi:amidohydrolase family protein [Arthrobacter sp. Sa2CUA1]|uniref:Amidohydrolase family protein n=1 Tax=Arthrobacter gallicola TaxID=2762225 RepID=A0ABR8UT27_9MICC|nr:amidohydrolase family protein [Arthrobacter gallicola]MBD7995719.1 amidohydrolase family protein [Arthrobacter gallicola]
MSDALPYAGDVIDAHHHVWDLERNHYPWLTPEVTVPHRYGDYTAIKRSYLADDYLADIAGHRVTASVYMEAEWDPADPIGESRYIADVAAESGYPGAAVAQAWLDAPDVAATLAAQAAFPLVRSVRHKPGGAASRSEAMAGRRSLMSDPMWRAGYGLLARYGLHFELQTPWWNLGEATELARDFPETTLVINHSGVLLDRSPETVDGWRAALERIAACPNVVIKASGLCVEGVPFSAALNREVVLEMIRIFGPDRVMFGSNFPVDGMFATYGELLGSFLDITSSLSDAGKSAVFFDTANRVYRPLAANAA